MLGTIVNTLAILLGGTLGVLLRRGLSERFKAIIMQAIPLGVLFIGLSMALGGLLSPKAEPLLFIISLVLGGIAGEALRLEEHLERLGARLQARFARSEEGGRFAEGFVSASLLFCVGAMAIVGSIQDGIKGDPRVLFAKSLLDGVTSLIMASSLGPGVLFSAFAVLLYQGTITLLAMASSVGINQDLLREMSIVGGILIFAIGLDMLAIKKIKVGNLLPAIFVPALYYFPPVHEVFLRLAELFGHR
ncbi:MAG: DUF554 domain-containing protein [Bacillota bacterium]